MGKYVSVTSSSGYGFSHNFSSTDWDRLRSLCGHSSGRVEFSEGSASTDGDTVFITLNSPGGTRTYDVAAADLFD